jgi:hypothetical protein
MGVAHEDWPVHFVRPQGVLERAWGPPSHSKQVALVCQAAAAPYRWVYSRLLSVAPLGLKAPDFALALSQQLLPGELEVVGGAEVLGFFQGAEGAFGFAGFVVEGGQQVEAVAQVAVVVLGQGEVVAGGVLGNAVEPFDQADFVLAMLDGAGQVSTHLADQRSAFLGHDDVIVGTEFV